MLRKIPPLIIFLIAVLAFAASCGDDPVNPVDPVLDIRSELPLPRFSPSGGSVELVFDSNLPWNITLNPAEDSSEGWYSVSADSGAAGNNISVTITAEPNESYEERGFMLTLNNDALQKEVEIIQSHKNVILAGENTYNITSDAQRITVEVQSNVEYEVSITNGADWIGEVPRTQSMAVESHTFEISANPEETNRQGKIVFKDSNSGLSDVLTVIQAGFVDPVPDRAALKAFYKAAGGDGWTNNANWCGDKPLSEWYGVETDPDGRVTGLRLSRNNLQGNILKTLVRLTGLKYIDLSWNAITDRTGFHDAGIVDMVDLEHIDLSHNGITGELPLGYGELRKLVYIDFSSNRIKSGLPLQWQPLVNNAEEIDLILYNNFLYGRIPSDFQNTPYWNKLALQIMRQDSSHGGLDTDNGYRLPDFTLTDLGDGLEKDIRDIYGNNELTFIVNWDPFQEESNKVLSTFIRKFYTQYHAQGLEVIAITPEGDEYREEAKRYIAEHNIPWITVTDYRDAKGRRLILMPYPYPSYMIISRTGEVINDQINGQYNMSCERFVDLTDLDYVEYLRVYLYHKLGRSTAYESTDYSMDKKYEVLQTATKGNGVDIVLMGDAFLDIDIETGYYKDIMKAAMEHFFSIEPTKSYREYFNVYMVYAVSKKSYFSEYPQTALGTVKVDRVDFYDTGIKGDIYKCESYARKCPIKSIYKTATIILTNNAAGVGQCYITHLGDTYAYCGNGNGYLFLNTFFHEAVGHGFGYLADEYWYYGAIPQSEKDFIRQRQSYGHYLNVDITDNPNAVLWSHLIGHSKYPYVGVYEGGYYYSSGVWRSEITSIMGNSNIEENRYFNARSRELIVKRILTLSGEGYTFEKFLAKDSDEGRPTGSSLQNIPPSPGESTYQHHRPIFIER